MSKYKKWLEEENLTLLEGWARNGLTDEQIAHNMGIAVRTLYEYKNNFPQILQALKKGKEVVDIEVENALLKRALGYDYDEKYFDYRLNESTGEYEKVPVKTVTKQAVPDTTAQIFWLKNRKKEQWRDKQPEIQDTEALKKLDDILSEIKEDAKRSSK